MCRLGLRLGLGSEPHVVDLLGSGSRFGGYLRGYYQQGGLSPGSCLQEGHLLSRIQHQHNSEPGDRKINSSIYHGTTSPSQVLVITYRFWLSYSCITDWHCLAYFRQTSEQDISKTSKPSLMPVGTSDHMQFNEKRHHRTHRAKWPLTYAHNKTKKKINKTNMQNLW